MSNCVVKIGLTFVFWVPYEYALYKTNQISILNWLMQRKQKSVKLEEIIASFKHLFYRITLLTLAPCKMYANALLHK